MSQLIDVGPGASSPGTDFLAFRYTFIDLANPANFNGVITSVSITYYGYSSGTHVANGATMSAFSRNGSIFTPRTAGVYHVFDTYGDITTPTTITENCYIPVMAGDFLGVVVNWSNANMSKSNSEGSGLWYYDWLGNGPDYTMGFDGPNTYTEYDADARVYIYGTGITIEHPYSIVYGV